MTCWYLDMPRLALLLAYFAIVSSGHQLPTSTNHLQSLPAGGDNEPLQAVDLQPVGQAAGVVGDVRDEGSNDPISRLANVLLAFNNPGLASRSPVDLNRRWRRQSLKMQEDFSSLKVAELKVLLKDKGLPVSGKKAELIARLEQHSAQPSEEEMPTMALAEGAETEDDDLDDLQDPAFENLDDLEDDLESALDASRSYVGEDDVDDADMSPKIQKRDLGDLSVAQLKDMLKDKGLKVAGKKAELIARLEEHMAVEESPASGETAEDADGTPKSQEQDLDGDLEDLEDAALDWLDDLKEVGTEVKEEPADAKTLGEDLGDLSVAQLKDMLKEKGLRVSGKKAELIARLEEHLAEEEASASVPPESFSTTDDADMLETELDDVDLKDLDEQGETPDDVDMSSKTQKSDLGDLSVSQLKYMLIEKGLSFAGKKAALIARLEEHMAVEESRASGETAEDAHPILESRERDLEGDELVSGVIEDADMSAKTQDKDLGGLSVAQLKDMLKEKGLKVSGKKAELIARLEEHRAEKEDKMSHTEPAASGVTVGGYMPPAVEQLSQVEQLDRIIAKRKVFAERVAAELEISVPLEHQFYTVEVLDLACEKLGISKEVDEDAPDPQGLIMKEVSTRLWSG